MAMFTRVVLLLIFQFSSAQLDLTGEIVLGCPDEYADFYFPMDYFPHKYYLEKTVYRDILHVFYKSTGDSPQVLIDIPGYRVTETERAKCFYDASDFDTPVGFQLKNLTLSDSGQYRAETWREGALKFSHTFQLTVCQERSPIIKYRIKNMVVNPFIQESFECKLTSFDLNQGDTMKIYRDYGRGHIVQIFPGGLPHGMKVTSSTIHFSDIHQSDGGQFWILTRRHNQCLRLKEMRVDTYDLYARGDRHELPKYIDEEHFASPGDTVTLLCPVEYGGKVEWQTPGKRLSYDPSLVITSLLNSVQEMYIDGQTYSLVIPSVTADHSGFYECKIHPQRSHTLSVCVVLEPTRVMFSQNDSATLVCASRETYVLSTQWFAGSESENKILDSWGASADLPEELRGRMNTSDLKHSLTISSLSPEDNRVYRCLFKQLGGRCASRCFHLEYKHPFGVDSTFYQVYSSLIGCGLMLVVVIIIVRSLRIKKKAQQAPQLYEEVRMDRLPRQPDSVEEQNRQDEDV